MDRRKFIKTTAAGLALVGTGLLNISCATSDEEDLGNDGDWQDGDAPILEGVVALGNNASAESFNAKIGLFRTQLREITEPNFLCFQTM